MLGFLYTYRKIVTFFFLIWSNTALGGQTPAYLHYDVGDGLPGNIVYCAAQDERGFMWFGTDKGLACFDGTRFRTFGVKEGLPDPEVLNLKLDSKGRLWISCFRKKPCYRYRGRIITEKEDALLNTVNFENSFYQFYEDVNSNLWFSGNGKDIFLLKENTFVKHHIDESAFFVVNIEGKVYAMNKSFFYLLNKFNSFDKIANFGFKDLDISMKGAVQSRSNVLLSIGEGIYLYELNNNIVKRIDERKGVSGTLFIDHHDRYWVCSTKDGAICFDNTKSNLSNPIAYLADEKINTMFEDSRGTLWFCTAGNGIYALPKDASQIFTTKDGLYSNNITTLAKKKSEGLVVGDNQGSIYEISQNVYPIANIGTGGLNRTRQIYLDSIGDSYIVSDFGVDILNKFGVRKIPNTRAAKYLLKTVDGLLVGLSGHLKFVDNKTGIQRILIPGRTTAILQDAAMNIWIGGIQGLYSSKDSFQLNFADRFPVLRSRIVALANGPEGTFWAVTPAHGVLSVKTHLGEIIGVSAINDVINSPIENIQSLYYQDNGTLWLATNSGIYGLKNNQCIFHFDRYNGLPDNDVNSVLVVEDTLWAGTVSGLSKIILNQKDNNDIFRTSFSALRYKVGDKNQLVHLDDSFSLIIRYKIPHNASIIELDLAGLDYSSRGNMRYSCIIQKRLPPVGLWTFDNIFIWLKNRFGQVADTTILDGNNLNFGVYLDPGRYAITVEAINANGIYSAIPAKIILDKPPLWYQLIWFYLMIWILVGCGIWQIFRGMLEYRKLQTAVSELQLQALQLQINPHFIGNSINSIQQFFFPPDPLRASDYIAVFTRLLRTTMDLAEKPFVPLKYELNYNEDYLKMIQLRFDKRFFYHINISNNVDLETPFPTMILQPVLENATIHGLAPQGPSRVNIVITIDENGLLTCTVTDNGVGLNQSKIFRKHNGNEHKSHGLSLLHRKIASLNELYDFDCKMVLEDISEMDSSLHGTKVTLSYYYKKVIKQSYR